MQRVKRQQKTGFLKKCKKARGMQTIRNHAQLTNNMCNQSVERQDCTPVQEVKNVGYLLDGTLQKNMKYMTDLKMILFQDISSKQTR